MAALLFMALLLAMAGRSSGSSWCVCKQMGDAVLQKTLDYACGAGADCNPIHQTGPCFNPNTVLAHCNYAVNSFFQRKGQSPGTCDFAGTAAVVPTDPSTAGCAYPASASASTAGGTTTVNPTTPGSSSTSPFVTNPSTGVLGGGNTSGAGINTDESDGGIMLHRNRMLPFLIVIMVFPGLMLWWG